jgi:hypothetical protein
MSDAATTISRNRGVLEATALFVSSALFAIAATAILAEIADTNSWCCVHSWALAHGTGLVVLLLFGLIGYHITVALGTRLHLLRPCPHFGWLPHLSYLGGAFGTLFFTQHLMWVGLIAGVSAVALRWRGRAVQPFGLAVVGLVVSVLAIAYWCYVQWIFWLLRQASG